MRLLLPLMLIALAVPAVARESPEWTYCDFGVDPKAGLLASKRWVENGMEAGTARGLYGVGGFAFLPQPRMEALAACDAALASPDLAPTNWTRRASLLAARSAHRLAAGDAMGALADLDAASATLPAGIDAAERDRSYGVSLGLLRALALARRGDPAGGLATARAAAALRPWSGQVQDIAARVLFDIGGVPDAAVADRRLALEPGAREARAGARQAAGDFAGALADWKRVRPAVTAPTTVRVPVKSIIADGAPGWPITMHDPERVGAAALAAAFAGDDHTAGAWLAEVRIAAAAAPAPTVPVLPKDITGPAFPTIDKAEQDKGFAQQVALVAAASLFRAGRVADARAALAKVEGPIETAAARQAVARITGHPLPPVATPGVDPRLLFALLPRYEGPDAVAAASSDDPLRGFLIGGRPNQRKPTRNSYAGGQNFFKASGFRIRPAADGSTTISFVGDASSSYAVEEMALLRAAELARDQGKPGLVVRDRRNYTRTQQLTYGGSSIGGPTPAGFSTEIDIDLAPGPDDRDRVTDAASVIAALAPIYKPATP